MRGFVTALEARVPGAAGHAERVAARSRLVARRLNWRHAIFGARLVASLEDPGLTAIVRHHHERIDGSG